ncbi:hypothetical protein [Frigoriglobus tundricola]|uniref:Uncharacterized protein n=1 Tax=Frigoriglobus tundricola TaxID=2774151 RepID=A0A6M5YYV2_9BACT|nr:hypothetical protein [Frigoriglobus tundricola]QJW98626.1 hypothetical protein FTUN_6221 [Frigoriglobus tundricola]
MPNDQQPPRPSSAEPACSTAAAPGGTAPDRAAEPSFEYDYNPAVYGQLLSLFAWHKTSRPDGETKAQ